MPNKCKYRDIYDLEAGEEMLLRIDKIGMGKLRTALQNAKRRMKPSPKFKTSRVNDGNFYLIKRTE